MFHIKSFSRDKNSLSKSKRVTARGRIQGTSGQIAIFIALIFQVLFVFFAMAINVGLVVHDKINLQSAADLAAYYAAGKQAENLNVIAHSNYQIRQAFKLLVYRYRVLGAMGIDGRGQGQSMAHPSYATASQNTDSLFQVPMAGGVRDSFAACIYFEPAWNKHFKTSDNICNTPDIDLPTFPTVDLSGSIFGVARAVTKVSFGLRDQYTENCEFAGAFNRYFAEASLAAFVFDQKNRKQVLYQVAANMSDKRDDLLDIQGNSVKQGALNTFLNNLTYANKRGFSNDDFEFLNPMGGIERKEWLQPMVAYLDFPYAARAKGQGAGECKLRGRKVNPSPLDEAATEIPDMGVVVREGQASAETIQNLLAVIPGLFSQSATERGPRRDDTYMDLGVEKNPWYMVYAGIKVKSRPRQLFFPFGEPVEFTARAFAKPFGGSIGPWYQHTWGRGAVYSSGDYVDPMAPPRGEVVTAGGGSAHNTWLNYSRYPGDPLGLKSRLALSAFQASGGSPLARQNDFLNLQHFDDLSYEASPSSQTDYLTWDKQNGADAPGRRFEIAAVAPDLFDTTYYSIEPNYTAVYQKFLISGRDRLGLGQIAIRGDLGGRGEGPFNVSQQMEVARSVLAPDAYWWLRKVDHVLTAYNYDQNNPGNFSADEFPTDFFGICRDEEERTNRLRSASIDPNGMLPPTPGSCLKGGRSGFQVKVVSEAYLNSDTVVNGRQSDGMVGSVLNSPDAIGF